MSLNLSVPVFRALLAVITVTFLGTAYSVIADTYLDTSNPLVANLPHPHHANSYFASKHNIFNTLFVKRAWGWTSLILLINTISNHRRAGQRIWRWALATAFWLSFVAWFFGPSLRARFATFSGAECVVQLPAAPLGDDVKVQIITVPAEYCISRTKISVAEHAHLFGDALLGNTGAGASVNIPEGWRGIPRLTRGHDVSGHVFLLTLSILSIVENLVLGTPAAGLQALTIPQLLVSVFSVALMGLWYWMLLMTSLYFHAPSEKVSGLLVGIFAYLFSRIPYPFGGEVEHVPKPSKRSAAAPVGITVSSPELEKKDQ